MDPANYPSAGLPAFDLTLSSVDLSQAPEPAGLLSTAASQGKSGVKTGLQREMGHDGLRGWLQQHPLGAEQEERG